MLNSLPAWLDALDDDDLLLLRRFLLASGSIKAVSAQYDVSYPTMRNRLDALIGKALAAEAPQSDDPMERLVQLLEREGVVGAGTANSLVHAHRRVVQDLKARLET